MSEHTKGPWIAVQHTRGSRAWRVTKTPGDAHGDICNVLNGLAASTPMDTAANARLIAAAPTLLDALKLLLAERHTHCAVGGDPDTCSVCGHNFRNTDKHFRVGESHKTDMDFARAAIQSATHADRDADGKL